MSNQLVIVKTDLGKSKREFFFFFFSIYTNMKQLKYKTEIVIGVETFLRQLRIMKRRRLGMVEQPLLHVFNGNKSKRLRLRLNKFNQCFGPQFVISSKLTVISLPKLFFPLSLTSSCEWRIQNECTSYRQLDKLPCWGTYVPLRAMNRKV